MDTTDICEQRCLYFVIVPYSETYKYCGNGCDLESTNLKDIHKMKHILHWVKPWTLLKSFNNCLAKVCCGNCW